MDYYPPWTTIVYRVLSFVSTKVRSRILSSIHYELLWNIVYLQQSPLTIDHFATWPLSIAFHYGLLLTIESVIPMKATIVYYRQWSYRWPSTTIQHPLWTYIIFWQSTMEYRTMDNYKHYRLLSTVDYYRKLSTQLLSSIQYPLWTTLDYRLLSMDLNPLTANIDYRLNRVLSSVSTMDYCRILSNTTHCYPLWTTIDYYPLWTTIEHNQLLSSIHYELLWTTIDYTFEYYRLLSSDPVMD